MLRKAANVAAVTGVGTAVSHHARTAIYVGRQAKAVVGGVATRQVCRRLHFTEQGAVPDRGAVQIRLPLEEIAYGREQAGRAIGIEIGYAHPPSIPAPCIGRRAPGHEHRIVIVKVRPGHAKRLEDPLVGEIAERLSANPLHDHRKQRVPRVAIDVLGARCEVEALLARRDVQNVRIGDAIFLEAAARQPEQRPLIAQPAGVRQQMTNRYGRAVVRYLRQILPDVIVD